VSAARHPATQQIMQWFSYRHLPAGVPREVSERFTVFAGNCSASWATGRS